MKHTIIHALLATSLAFGTGVVSAATYSFTTAPNSSASAPVGAFASGSTAGTDGGFASQTLEYKSITYADPLAGSLKVEAFANTGASGLIESAYLTYQGSTSGLGVTSREVWVNGTNNNELTATGGARDPEHSFDNRGATELLLFSFSSAANVNTVDIGWWSNDSDLTLWAYTGSSAFASLGNQSYSTLAASTNWTKWQPSSVSNSDPSFSSRDSSGKLVYSSYWLLTPGSTADTSKDYIKLAGIGATIAPPTSPPPATGVPEPESIALMGAALAGMAFVRRRRQAW